MSATAQQKSRVITTCSCGYEWLWVPHNAKRSTMCGVTNITLDCPRCGSGTAVIESNGQILSEEDGIALMRRKAVLPTCGTSDRLGAASENFRRAADALKSARVGKITPEAIREQAVKSLHDPATKLDEEMTVKMSRENRDKCMEIGASLGALIAKLSGAKTSQDALSQSRAIINEVIAALETARDQKDAEDMHSDLAECNQTITHVMGQIEGWLDGSK